MFINNEDNEKTGLERVEKLVLGGNEFGSGRKFKQGAGDKKTKTKEKKNLELLMKKEEKNMITAELVV